MREETTLQDYGTVGNSQVAGTDICNVFLFTPGRYRIWGTCRHTLADGCRLLIGGSVIMEITNEANTSQDFGPIVIDILSASDTITLELFVATGAADTASGNLYAQKVHA